MASSAQAPLGSSLSQPPKQRGMPELSTLQTSFLPLQQFWLALMLSVPPSGSSPLPQMLPVALQAVPLSQRPVWVAVSIWHTTPPSGLAPPQHSSSSLQDTPVNVHPEAG